MREKGLTVATAESCTAGLLAALITEAPGSSDYYLGGLITYGNAVKTSLLGVTKKTLERYGAVSRETAVGMARGAKRMLKASIAVSVTGIAGPAGGSAKKPVGTVYIAGVNRKKTVVRKFLFKGNRRSVRRQSAQGALEMIMGLI